MRRAQSGRRVPDTSLSIESAGALRVFILVHVWLEVSCVCVRRRQTKNGEIGRRRRSRRIYLGRYLFFRPPHPPVKTVPLSPPTPSQRDSPVILLISRRKENYFVDLVNPPPPEVNIRIYYVFRRRRRFRSPPTPPLAQSPRDGAQRGRKQTGKTVKRIYHS